MLTAILAAFAGGIILNFMPCVFPVISLKALGLLRHQGNSASARTEGLGFLLGVIFTMMALAAVLALRAGGTAVGWGFQLQSPLVIACAGADYSGRGAELLGVFEVGLSLQRAGEINAEGRGAFVRSALTGALAIVVATPARRRLWQGPWVMRWFSRLSWRWRYFWRWRWGLPRHLRDFTLPGMAKRLPRPGAWMDILKRGLAFPMFGAFAWLVWVLAQQAGTTALAAMLVCAVVVLPVAVRYRPAQALPDTAMPRWRYRQSCVSGCLHPLPGVMHTQPAAGKPACGHTRGEMVAADRGEMRGHGKAIFVNFTASWCITCQVNDRRYPPRQ
jgi:thiol:disulfide interchange protein DsbD